MGLSIEQFVKLVEEDLKPLLGALHNYQGSRRNHVFFDGNRWGFSIDGIIPQCTGSYSEIKRRLESYIKDEEDPENGLRK